MSGFQTISGQSRDLKGIDRRCFGNRDHGVVRKGGGQHGRAGTDYGGAAPFIRQVLPGLGQYVPNGGVRAIGGVVHLAEIAAAPRISGGDKGSAAKIGGDTARLIYRRGKAGHPDAGGTTGQREALGRGKGDPDAGKGPGAAAGGNMCQRGGRHAGPVQHVPRQFRDHRGMAVPCRVNLLEMPAIGAP